MMKMNRLTQRFATTRDEYVKQRRIVSYHLRFMHRAFRETPIDLHYWVFYRRLMGLISSERNPISPPVCATTGASLDVRELEELLAEDRLGEWALDAATLSLVWGVLCQDAPRSVLECGSGISTLALARYAESAALKGKECLVVSLEQSQDVKALTEKRLKASSLERFVSILHCPLDSQGNYSFGALEELLSRRSDREADLVLIDGPGPPGNRLETLPMLLPYCRNGATWLLDDAFRDAELSSLRKWRRMRSIEVRGIYPVGKGLAVGCVGK